MTAPDEPEDLQPGLARERTQLAWTRTALSFAAVGGVILKTNVGAGLAVLGVSAAVWGLRRLFPVASPAGTRSTQLLLVTVTVTAVALVALAVAFLGHTGFLR
jgi:uncharacterized membrane protein YidH (DUF202 family)